MSRFFTRSTDSQQLLLRDHHPLFVAERIDRVRRFTMRMHGERVAIVRLTTWEIGKSLSDARKEFDRTVANIEDTVDVLKDLDQI